MYLLYSILLTVAFVLALPYYLWKGRSTGKYLATFRARMGRLPANFNREGEPSLWVHAVSVGEVVAARRLIRGLKGRFPSHGVFLSTTTVTGQAVAQKDGGDADGVFFAPFDWARPVRRVLTAVRPALLVLVETEIWPNLIHETRRRGARVAIVNGRVSPRSFARYRRVRLLLEGVLAEVDLFLMQGEAHARRILEMGAPPDRVRVLGNLKFDALPEPRTPEELARLFEGAPPLWIAGSTVGGEEEAVLAAFRDVRERVRGARLVLAPRHPERFDEAVALTEGAGFRCERRSRLGDKPWGEEEVLVLDTLGELAQIYPLATVVFVGGSLVPAGGHNVLEAAVAGRAVIVGPHMENFQEIADQFGGEGALVRIATAEALAGEVVSLMTDAERRRRIGEKARGLIEANRGALDRTVEALASLVP